MRLATVLYPIGMDLGGAFSSSSQSVGGGKSSSASPEKAVLCAVVPVVCLMVSSKRTVGWKGWLVLGSPCDVLTNSCEPTVSTASWVAHGSGVRPPSLGSA